MRRTDQEIIGEHDLAIGEGKELEGYERVHGIVSKNLTFSTSVRFPPEEFSKFTAYARSRGMTLSAFLRAAAEAALGSEDKIERIAAIQEARQKAAELKDALDRASA